jgi:hypothetical protein
MASAALDGIQAEMTRSGKDVGESSEPQVEEVAAPAEAEEVSDVAKMLGPDTDEGDRPAA